MDQRELRHDVVSAVVGCEYSAGVHKVCSGSSDTNCFFVVGRDVVVLGALKWLGISRIMDFHEDPRFCCCPSRSG